MLQFVWRKEVHAVNLTFCVYTGSFDIKASRVQDCAGLDMTKYGHSQTGKIKSKRRHFRLWLFPFFFLNCFVDSLQSKKVFLDCFGWIAVQKTQKYPSALPLILSLCNIPNALITRLTGSSLESRIPPAFNRSDISQQPRLHLEEGVFAHCPMWPYSVGHSANRWKSRPAVAALEVVLCVLPFPFRAHFLLTWLWAALWDRPWCVDITDSCGVHFGGKGLVLEKIKFGAEKFKVSILKVATMFSN